MSALVLVCGGRDYADLEFLVRTLDEINDHLPDGVGSILHGDAPGADTLAGAWARCNGVCEIKVPAQWEYYPKGAAGPIRNRWMALLNPTFVVAFPGGPGTLNMIKTARQRNILVFDASLMQSFKQWYN